MLNKIANVNKKFSYETHCSKNACNNKLVCEPILFVYPIFACLFTNIYITWDRSFFGY